MPPAIDQFTAGSWWRDVCAPVLLRHRNLQATRLFCQHPVSPDLEGLPNLGDLPHLVLSFYLMMSCPTVWAQQLLLKTGNFYGIFLSCCFRYFFKVAWETRHKKIILASIFLSFDPISVRVNINSSPPEKNGCHFADDIFRCIFVYEKFCILIKISLKFVLKGPIDNNPALVQILAWRRIGDKPLFEPMLTQITDAYMRHLGRWIKQ